MIRVGIVGSTGYAGAELVRILSGHPDVEITVLTSRQHIGIPFSTVYPALAGVVTLCCEEYSAEQIAGAADVVFTALPHKLPMAIVPELIDSGKKVVDLSADFRIKNVAQYEAHYQPHEAKDYLEKAEYGLCEVYHDRIRETSLVGNPGCYPTSILLPLVPLLKNNLIDVKSIIADSKSGVSGAGRSPSLTTLYSEVAESFKAYKVAQHRHNPEIDEVLTREADTPVAITFVPHLVPMSRGMFSTIYATPSDGVTGKDINDCLAGYYSDRPFIRLLPDGHPPNTLHVRGTNYCDIGFKLDKKNRRLILMSAIDNLVKGAAGQAVQCMNIMMGLDETSGLKNTPYPL
jgi:N-acetyl-gamma-glutamyl-phosphate reductase